MANLLRVAACQMAVTADVKQNLMRLRGGIEDAAARGAAAVAFPECALTGYPPVCHDTASRIDLAALPAAHGELCSAAQAADIWVIAGTIREEKGDLYNTALIIGSDGVIRGNYDKIHLIGDDHSFFRAGDSLPIFDLDGVLFGVQICYDARFPEPFRLLKKGGTSVVFNLSNACGTDTWKVPVLEGVYRARASENCLYLVAVNAAGPLQMAVSRIVNVEGLSLAAANQDAEELIVADLDLSLVGAGHFGSRRSDLFDVIAKAGDGNWRDETSPQSST